MGRDDKRLTDIGRDRLTSKLTTRPSIVSTRQVRTEETKKGGVSGCEFSAGYRRNDRNTRRQT